MNTQQLQHRIEAAYERRQELSSSNVDADTRAAIDAARSTRWIAASAASPKRSMAAGRCTAWLKKAVLLYFRTHDNVVVDAGYARFYDKVPLKYAAHGCGAVRAAAACAWCRTRWCATAPTSRPTRC